MVRVPRVIENNRFSSTKKLKIEFRVAEVARNEPSQSSHRQTRATLGEELNIPSVWSWIVPIFSDCESGTPEKESCLGRSTAPGGSKRFLCRIFGCSHLIDYVVVMRGRQMVES